MRDETVADRPPDGVQLDRGDGEHEETQPAVSENALDPVERRHPDDNGERGARDQDEPPVGKPGEELRGQRHEVDDLCGDERHQTGLEAEPLSHGIEDRLARDRRDAAAHLRVRDDPDHADHDDPEELIAEGRARGDVEDQIADVDEPSDRGEDAERDLKDLHFESWSAASASSESGCCRDAATSRSVG